jgi:23S rRNA (pseudouridine1915-N3)-methyltransferase
MNIRIIAVGKIKEKFLQEGIAEYEKRLRPYVKLQFLEIAEEKRPLSASPATEAAAVEKEGQRILAAVPEGSHVVCLDVKGGPVTSEGFSAMFREWELAGKNMVVFVIGGDLGLSPAVHEQSAIRISLSPMTFTHPMARFILMEQIYRAFRILRGEPYHK